MHLTRHILTVTMRGRQKRNGAREARGGVERRRLLMEWMRAARGPVSGGELARKLRVSRQCLVQDVAILRAGGEEILSTPQGYRLPSVSAHAQRAIVACQHPPERTEEELNILVDEGSSSILCTASCADR
jgi:transcriptional regulator of NAD metabolism